MKTTSRKKPNPKKTNERPKTIPVTHTFIVKRSDELLNFLLARFEGKLSRNSVKKLVFKNG